MFYTFSQNNSGGSFSTPAIHVIIEANSSEEANQKAKDIGLYFYGCDTGEDCSCCGDRWYAAWNDSGEERPEVYGQSVFEYVNDWSSWATEKTPFAVVHYLNGDVKTVQTEKETQAYKKKKS